MKIAELANRYFNGSATLRVALLNGVLDVAPDSIEVRGKPLPEAFAQGIIGKNLAEKAMDDPKQREALDKLESIVVKDGTIILTPKAPRAAGNAPAEGRIRGRKARSPRSRTRPRASGWRKDGASKDAEKPAPEEEPETPKPEAPAVPKAA